MLGQEREIGTAIGPDAIVNLDGFKPVIPTGFGQAGAIAGPFGRGLLKRAATCSGIGLYKW